MLLTYGHGTDSAERTVATLAGAGVSSLVDIRTAPGSRRNPQFARAAMEEWLPEAGIAYRWDKRLGGFRKLVRWLYRVEVVGRERIPSSGPCILTPNHESVVDPFILAVATTRPIHYMTKAELFRFRREVLSERPAPGVRLGARARGMA